jgi:hypothetical protein
LLSLIIFLPFLDPISAAESFIEIRVTRWVCEKIDQNVAKLFFVKIIAYT